MVSFVGGFLNKQNIWIHKRLKRDIKSRQGSLNSQEDFPTAKIEVKLSGERKVTTHLREFLFIYFYI